jgi:hypothetical protein
MGREDRFEPEGSILVSPPGGDDPAQSRLRTIGKVIYALPA